MIKIIFYIIQKKYNSDLKEVLVQYLQINKKTINSFTKYYCELYAETENRKKLFSKSSQ